MRIAFRSAVYTGLAGRENALFIALCAGIVLGMLVPLPSINTSWRKNKALFQLSAIAAVPCTILALYTLDVMALVFTSLSSFFAAIALGCSLYRISLQLDQKSFGMFYGTAFAVSEGMLLILLLFPQNKLISIIVLAALCLLLLIAALAYHTGAAAQESNEVAQNAASPSGAKPWKYLLALSLYCIAGGMLDNLTAFDDAFFGIPNLLVFVYSFSVPAHLVLGWLFCRFDWRRIAMLGVLLICLGQSLSFFSSISALAVPYLALTTLGIILMEFIVRALPSRYALGSGRAALVSRLGYAGLYSGFLITSALFEFIPRSRYFFVLGIVLILAFAILSLLHMASSEEELSRHNRIMEELRQLSISGTDENSTNHDTEARLKQMGLTSREREVCVLLLSAYSIKQIAVDLKIAYATANVHCTNLYRKLNISSRAELFQKFGVTMVQNISE